MTGADPAAARRLAIGLILTSGTFGCGESTTIYEPLALRPVAESPAPFSRNNHIALADEDTACVIESFEYRVACFNPNGTVVAMYGRQGQGPGEFLNPVGLFRQSRGTLAVFDSRSARLTTIESDPGAMSEIVMPSRFWINAVQGYRVHGFVGYGPRPNQPPYVENQVLDLRSGEVVWRRSIYETGETECGDVGVLVPHPAGGYVLNACGKDLVFLEELDADNAHVIRSPAYREELPNQRDVEAYLTNLARLGGNRGLVRSAMEPYAAAFREEPKSWFHGPRMFSFDGQRQLWVATTRDRDHYSYFDIWVDTRYVGSVRIQDRLIGHDILGSTLVVLVERQPDPNGIAARAFDWYDIAEVDFGRTH